MSTYTVARFWQLRRGIRHGGMSCDVVNLRANPRAAAPAAGQSAERWGFTLIETMIVVVIVGVLATLATFGVMKYVRTARTSEALAMMVDIKGAQEVARDDTFRYIGLSDYTSWHPIDPPGNFKTEWNRNNGEASAKIRELGVVSSGPVYFTYTVVAGLAADPVPTPPCQRNLNLPAPAGAPFFVIVAKGDLDGDLTNSYVIGHSFGSDLYVEKEGE